MKHFFYKGKDNLLHSKDSELLEDKTKIVKKEFSKLLESRNLSFLMGSGCSLGDKGIPTMKELAAGFFEPEEKVFAVMSTTLKGLVLSAKSKAVLGIYKIKYNEAPFIKDLENFLCNPPLVRTDIK
jgi:hypothetical protein